MIRPMQDRDVEAVMAIDRLCPGQARHATPWSRDDYRRELARPQVHIDVMQSPGDDLLAYCHRWHVVDEMQIMNVATHPTARRLGHARALLLHALGSLDGIKLVSATLEVSAQNAPAIALYQALAFQIVGRRAGYYREGGADALLMTRGAIAP